MEVDNLFNDKFISKTYNQVRNMVAKQTGLKKKNQILEQNLKDLTDRQEELQKTIMAKTDKALKTQGNLFDQARECKKRIKECLLYNSRKEVAEAPIIEDTSNLVADMGITIKTLEDTYAYYEAIIKLQQIPTQTEYIPWAMRIILEEQAKESDEEIQRKKDIVEKDEADKMTIRIRIKTLRKARKVASKYLATLLNGRALKEITSSSLIQAQDMMRGVEKKIFTKDNDSEEEDENHSEEAQRFRLLSDDFHHSELDSTVPDHSHCSDCRLVATMTKGCASHLSSAYSVASSNTDEMQGILMRGQQLRDAEEKLAKLNV